MHMPFDSEFIDTKDVSEFIERVKEDFEHAIEIYARTVRSYALQIDYEKLKFVYTARNEEVSRIVLSDDGK